MDEQLNLPDDIPGEIKDAVELVQKQLKQSMTSLDKRVANLSHERKWRTLAAYSQKTFCVISSLLIAAGFLYSWLVQALGLIVAILVALEQRVVVNHERLLSVVFSLNAYDRLRKQAVSQHNKEIVEVVLTRDSNSKEAANKLIKLCGGLRDLLAKKGDEVEANLKKKEYEAISRLSLEDVKVGKEGDN